MKVNAVRSYRWGGSGVFRSVCNVPCPEAQESHQVRRTLRTNSMFQCPGVYQHECSRSAVWGFQAASCAVTRCDSELKCTTMELVQWSHLINTKVSKFKEFCEIPQSLLMFNYCDCQSRNYKPWIQLWKTLNNHQGITWNKCQKRETNVKGCWNGVWGLLKSRWDKQTWPEMVSIHQSIVNADIELKLIDNWRRR